MRYLLSRLRAVPGRPVGVVDDKFSAPPVGARRPGRELIVPDDRPTYPLQIDALRVVYGVSTRALLFSQYTKYLGQLAHGNLGISITYFPTTVSAVIRSAILWTLLLGGLSALIGFVIGVSLGILVAWRHATVVDSVVTPSTIFMASVPYFWLATTVVFIFAVKVHWFPIEH